MTVAELIAALAEFPPETRVVVANVSEMDGDPLATDPELVDGWLGVGSADSLWSYKPDQFHTVKVLLL